MISTNLQARTCCFSVPALDFELGCAFGGAIIASIEDPAGLMGRFCLQLDGTDRRQLLFLG
jgi:hypothetical protein